MEKSPIESRRPPLTPGRMFYLAYHLPRALIERSRREGGPLEQWINARGREAMRARAPLLPPAPAAEAGAPEVHFLTGRRFWYQTAFCARSLVRHAGPLRPVFVDDGTFDAGLRDEATRLFPGARILGREEIAERLDRVLPERLFPALRGQRRTYIHLRKLTDVHAGLAGWRVVLDSDMLFFRRPGAFLAWLGAPDRPIHMLDVHDAYGYPTAALEALAGTPVPARLNVGVFGLRSESIDWARLEQACARLIADHGTSYYLEQALSALLCAGVDHLSLPQADYRLMPDDAECRNPSAILHHYVDRSKRGYFRHAWRVAGRGLTEGASPRV